MNTKKDWRNDFAEVEVWVHAEFRHKLAVKIPTNSTARQEVFRILKSQPLSYWCDPEEEDWINHPNCEEQGEDARFEVGQDLPLDVKDLEEANSVVWKVKENES